MTRNSKAYASVLMFLELVSAGRFTLADGLGVGDEVRDARDSWGLLPTLSFFGLSPGRHKTESTAVLEAFVKISTWVARTRCN